MAENARACDACRFGVCDAAVGPAENPPCLLNSRGYPMLSLPFDPPGTGVPMNQHLEKQLKEKPFSSVESLASLLAGELAKKQGAS